MFSATFVTLALSFLGLTAASPIARRSACVPNFQGKSVILTSFASGSWIAEGSIAGSTIETTFNTPTEFLIAQDGQDPTGFTIKPVIHTQGLTVSILNGAVALETINHNDVFQDFFITCDACGIDGVNATGCKICDKRSPGLCIAAATAESHVMFTSSSPFPVEDFSFNITAA